MESPYQVWSHRSRTSFLAGCWAEMACRWAGGQESSGEAVLVATCDCGSQQGVAVALGRSRWIPDIFRGNMGNMRNIILYFSIVDRYFNKKVSSVMISVECNLSFLTMFN